MHNPAAPAAPGYVELAHALVQHVAERVGLRALALKGPVADAHRIRPPRSHADADVLVEQDALPEFLRALEAAGWTPREYSELGHSLPSHSASLMHPAWPCDIDVHSDFPGLLAPREATFEALWARRCVIPMAGVSVVSADRLASILIAAVHALRTPSQTPRHGFEYTHLADTVLPGLSREEAGDLVELAQRLGCIDTARPLLEHLGVPLPAKVPPGVDSQLDEWRFRVGAGGTQTARLWQGVLSTPWRRRPAMLLRALWPSASALRLDNPDVGPRRRDIARLRLARFARALRQLPQLRRAARMARRGELRDLANTDHSP